MIEEMQWGLAELPDDDRAEADRRVLEGVFFGRLATASLRGLWKFAPRMMNRVMAAASPSALSWLVGPMEASQTENVIAECKFRRDGGPELCERICRQPSQSFCASRTVPVRLNPDPDSLGCRWTWGVDP